MQKPVSPFVAGRSRYPLAAIILMLVPLGGCRICASDEDIAYPSYGGAWERTIRNSGRVASVFDSAGAKSPVLAARESGLTADELERGRRKEDSTDSIGSGESNDDHPENNDQNSDNRDSDDQNSDDRDLEREMRELRESEMNDIKIIPGEALPPLLR